MTTLDELFIEIREDLKRNVVEPKRRLISGEYEPSHNKTYSIRRTRDQRTIIKCNIEEDHINIALSIIAPLPEACLRITRERGLRTYEKFYTGGCYHQPFLCYYASTRTPDGDYKRLSQLDDIIEICNQHQLFIPQNQPTPIDENSIIEIDNRRPISNRGAIYSNISNTQTEALMSEPLDIHPLTTITQHGKTLNYDNIIKDTYNALQEVTRTHSNENREGGIIMPIYSPLVSMGIVTVRISEQELKQAFIRHLPPNIFHSVETPTIDGYSFSDIPKICPRERRNYQFNEGDDSLEDDSQPSRQGTSARFDLSIYDEHNRNNNYSHILSHVEFKQGAATPHEIIKDLLKLSYEPYCPDIKGEDRETIQRYFGNNEMLMRRTHLFIHLIDTFNKRTLMSLSKKYFNLNKDLLYDSQSKYSSVYQQIINNLNLTNNKIYIYVLTLENQYENTNIYRIDYSPAINAFRSAIQNNQTPLIRQVNLNEIWQRVPIPDSNCPS